MMKNSLQYADWSHFSQFEKSACDSSQESIPFHIIDPSSVHEKVAAWLDEYRYDGTQNEATADFDKMLNCSQVWQNAVLNWGAPRPVQWVKSGLHAACFSFLGLDPKKDENEVEKRIILGGEDEKELEKLLDLHQLVLDFDDSCDKERIVEYNSLEDSSSRVQTADEVIEEIEEILLTADEQDAAFDDQLEQQTGIMISDEISFEVGSELYKTSIPDFSHNDCEKTKSLKLKSIIDLNEELNKLEGTVKYLSECLLKELNMRDEYLYEKEVRSTFISKILDVQSKQDEFHQKANARTGFSKFGKLTKSLSMSNASVSSPTPGRFLTTVIPFDDGGIPSMEGLHALIKLLDAIKEDSNEVPSLITKYILKVLYPAPTANSTLNL